MNNINQNRNKTINPPSPKTGSNLDKDYQEIGNAILTDKERSKRPFAYIGLAIMCGALAQGIYKFWLSRKFWGSNGDQEYLWGNNLGWHFLFGAVGAGIAIAGLKIYFRSQDKKYNKVLDKL